LCHLYATLVLLQQTKRFVLKKLTITTLLLISYLFIRAENGYDLWLRYRLIDDNKVLTDYLNQVSSININANSPTILAAKEELLNGIYGLTGKRPAETNAVKNGCIIAGTPSSSQYILQPGTRELLSEAGKEGFLLLTKNISLKKVIVIAANTDVGILYGAFHLLRLMQTHKPINDLHIVSSPLIKLRLLDHWDNLNRTVERGYAGFSLWNWQTLPGYIDKRYKDYARANASIGINGTVLNNVNANALILTKPYLKKVAALANVFRPYGIRVYLSARFSAPVEIGGLKTADPFDSAVQRWWKNKAAEIYSLVPDFGGFLVKANSEGQPGPQKYDRTHADGANMLSDVLAPYNGIVMWRAFIYNNETHGDRHKQAYNEFVPLDGKFKSNVMLQVKNGPIDFQPREPFHPLFGAMHKTPLMMEFQLTQEYLGFATHLVFLAPLFKECLESDTYCNGDGSTVAKVIDGSIDKYNLSGMAGVSNIGNDINWCGHPFAQANWYALGRLAWNHNLSSEQIADEWLRMTFSNDELFVGAVKKMMLSSREITVKYMTPVGLHHLMGSGHHYGPAPWVDTMSRTDWNPVYYHKADSAGIGFDRTSGGSNAVSQYAAEMRDQFENLSTCPEKYLLWFHHLPWSYKTKGGRSLWNELCYQYYSGVDSVRWMQRTWSSMKDKIDSERYEQVKMLLQIQENEAVWWRNACVLYFQTFSKMPISPQYEKPEKTLEYYKQSKFTVVPGN
jgi:alpha-glucuronidase